MAAKKKRSGEHVIPAGTITLIDITEPAIRITGSLTITEEPDTITAAGHGGLRIEAIRALTKEDILAIKRRSPEISRLPFNRVARFLDLLLEPDAAEAAIGDLAEQYARRLAVNPGHAKRWLVAQVIWIVFGRAMDVFGRFMRARAGK